MKTCLECGQPFDRRVGERPAKFARRQFCGRSCAAKQRSTMTAAEIVAQRRARIIEDVEWIIGTDSPEHIAHRLGYGNAHNLERQLYRWGRADLANRIARESVAA